MKKTIAFLSLVFLLTFCQKLDRMTGLKTIGAYDVTYKSAIAKATVEDLSENQHSEFGFCYAIGHEPTISDSVVLLGAYPKLGNYETLLQNLQQATEYFVCAYIKEAGQYIYGKATTFTTDTAPVPTIEIIEASNISYNSATFGGNIISGNGDSVSSSGLCWDTIVDPTINSHTKINQTGNRNFQLSITGLTPGTTYYGRAFAINNAGVGYSQNTIIETIPFNLPDVTTGDAQQITDRNALLAGYKNSDGGGPTISLGFCFGLSQDLNVENSDTIASMLMQGPCGIGNWAMNLEPNTTYFFRAFARNYGGVGYGEVKSFTTTDPREKPQLANFIVQDYFSVRIQLSANIVSDGGGIDEAGFIWSATDPDLEYNSLNAITTLVINAQIEEKITKFGFNIGDSYYFRAYAKNSGGIGYSEVIQFTIPPNGPPIVSTTKIYRVLAHSARIIGSESPSIAYQGWESVNGVCWNTSGNPLADDGSSTYTTYRHLAQEYFELEITGLQPNTTYFARVYGESENGIGYGDIISFTTLSEQEVVLDFDGNEYASVNIGTQIWLASNLQTTHYSGGYAINGHFAYNHDIENAKSYGYLYNQQTAVFNLPQGGCPDGWHVPGKTEWETLINFLGGNTVAGNHLKEAGNIHWANDNLGDNSSNFTAIGAGDLRNGDLEGIHEKTRFWTSTPIDELNTWSVLLQKNTSSVSFETSAHTEDALSIRCIKNNN